MISGTKTCRGRSQPAAWQIWLFGWCLLVWCWPGSAQELRWTLDDLMALLRSQTQVQARFVERKQIAGVQSAVESSGELSFQAPALMRKHTLAPRAELLLLDGQTVHLERGNRRRTLQLDQVPELALHLEGVRALLAGDRTTLERLYQVALTGSANAWTLKLQPRSQGSALKELRLQGAAADVQRVEVLLADGDSSVMLISKVAP